MFRKFQAHPDLKDFVLFYFEMDWQSAQAHQNRGYLCLPTGCSFIGFQKKGRMQVKIDDFTYETEAYFLNVQTTIPYEMFTREPDLQVIAACLKPTAIAQLFKIDVSRIINTGMNPRNLFADHLKNFSDVFEKETKTSEILALLDEIFLKQLEHSRPKSNFIDIAVDLIMQQKGIISIEELVGRFKVSTRYFQKKFKEMVGISPLLYIKIIRYNFLFSSFSQQSPNFASSAAPLYFYDSAHYSKSFKDYLGMNPSEFDLSQYPFIKLTAIEQAVWVNAFRELAD